jgi:hypothetical protein
MCKGFEVKVFNKLYNGYLVYHVPSKRDLYLCLNIRIAFISSVIYRPSSFIFAADHV